MTFAKLQQPFHCALMRMFQPERMSQFMDHHGKQIKLAVSKAIRTSQPLIFTQLRKFFEI